MESVRSSLLKTLTKSQQRSNQTDRSIHIEREWSKWSKINSTLWVDAQLGHLNENKKLFLLPTST